MSLLSEAFSFTVLNQLKPSITAAVAKHNAQLNAVNNIQFLHSDWFSVLNGSETTDESVEEESSSVAE